MEWIYGTEQQCKDYNDKVYELYYKNDRGTTRWATPEFDEDNDMWRIAKHQQVEKLEGMYNENELWIEIDLTNL